MQSIKSLAIMAVALGILSTAQTASAKVSGRFELISHFSHNYTTLEHTGQTVTGGALRGMHTIIESDGAPFAKGTGGLVVCVVYARKSDTGLDSEAPCIFTDNSDDKWFSFSTRNTGDLKASGSGGEGLIEILDGTGKYEGLTGICEYTIEYWPDNKGVSRMNCRWRKTLIVPILLPDQQ